jgi:hypothetical protein
MRARNELCRFLSRVDVAISIGESAAFEEYIKNAHNPKFSAVSTQTTTRDLAKMFSDRKNKLIEVLSSDAVNCVCLTSDIWSGKAKEDYLSVVAHYINPDWQLEKRVLGLVLIDCSHNGQNIADRVFLKRCLLLLWTMLLLMLLPCVCLDLFCLNILVLRSL